MKALCWFGANDVRVEQVPDPHVINPHDAVIRISSTSICGSDLHLYHGYVPAMKKGDILGHEFMGEIVETGKAVSRLKSGDRVVVPFAISCGKCFYCADGMFSLCDNTNPNYRMAEKKYGYSGAGLFGYSHLFGGYAGGQAEFARVPFADVGCVKIPDGVADERVLFLSDVLPTGYMAAENCDIHPGDIVAVWGCGPVGQMAIKCAYLLGAERVIAIDHMPARLALAQTRGGADVLNYEEVDILDELKARTGGRGPDACIDAVGMEAHGKTLDAIYDYAKQALRLETDRLHALRAAIQACRKGGTLSVSGVYGGILDKVPLGAAFAKGLKIRMGQTHVQRYMQPLMDRILNDGIDASYLITHQLRLDDAPIGYKIFDDDKNHCVKVVMKPN